jgi:alpha-1,6-mannosyltransferase
MMRATMQSLGGFPRARLWGLGLALAALTAIGPAIHLRFGGWAYLAMFLIAAGGIVLSQRLAQDIAPRDAVIAILATALLMRLALLFVEPYLSTDIYRYIWDGRVQAAGINPYRYLPSAPELASLRDAAIYPNINRADYAPTIYPPVAQAIFLAVTRLGESVVVMKLGLVACEIGLVAALLAILKHLGMPLARVAIYAWHPLGIWEIAGNGHVDAAMAALMIAGLLLFLKDRLLPAGVLVTLAALVKPTALLALPVFWRPWNWRLPAVVAVTALVAYLPYLSVGRSVFGFLGGYVEEEGFASGRGFNTLWLLERIAGPLPGATVLYVLVAALLMSGAALAVGFRKDRTPATALACLSWLLVTFLVLASPHYPWYFLALVPVLALHGSAAGWVLSLGSVAIYGSVDGVGWPEYDTRIALFTAATLAAVAYDARRFLFRTAVPAASGDAR